MTREELDTKIQELTEAANGLEEPDRTFKLSDIDRLKIKLEGMALDELRQKMEQIQLPDLQKIDKQIAAAKDATKANQARVDGFNTAFAALKTAIGIVL